MALPWGTSWRLSGHRDPMEATVSELTICPPEPQHPSLDMRAPHTPAARLSLWPPPEEAGRSSERRGQWPVSWKVKGSPDWQDPRLCGWCYEGVLRPTG